MGKVVGSVKCEERGRDFSHIYIQPDRTSASIIKTVTILSRSKLLHKTKSEKVAKNLMGA